MGWIAAYRRRATALLVALLVAACTSGGGPSPGSQSTSPPPAASDPFTGLPYRLDLPADWIVLGSPAYDATLDSVPDVAGWLDLVDLRGSNAFRAYEPLPRAGGLRIAINPRSPWRSEEPLFHDEGLVAALPGVTGAPVGDMVGVGEAAKAVRFRWAETLDWGSGAPSARTVVGYEVMGEFEPVIVVFSYPAETDRLAEVEALMATLDVLANPVMSLPPGVTMPPSPTPFDKLASAEPTPPFATATPATTSPSGIGHLIHVNLYVPLASDVSVGSACDAAALSATGPVAATIPGSHLQFFDFGRANDERITRTQLGEQPVPQTGTVVKPISDDAHFPTACLFSFDVPTTADVDNAYVFALGSVYLPVPVILRADLEAAGWVANIGVNPQ
jgi:hypothetical protein